MADTIVAVSSPPGSGERGVVRVSGPEAGELVRAALGLDAAPGARALVDGRFDDGRGTQPVLVLWMPAPRSYTREDVAEFHLPGSPPLLAAALERLVALGARPASPGEFTRRAFLNGRLDLTRAEGVLELVNATNEGERRSAAALLEGGLERRVATLRDRFEDLRMLCEASLDFDESDTGHVPNEELERLAVELDAELDAALRWEVRRQPPSALPRVLLHGAPNAGKSSLFNRLAPDAGALTSDHAGTTRDGLTAAWPLGDDGRVACLLIDTPGVDALAGGADALAQELAERERRAADLVLWVVDATRGEDAALEAEARALPVGVPVVQVWNKLDAPGARTPRDEERSEQAGSPAPVRVFTSAADGRGLRALAREVTAALGLAPGVNETERAAPSSLARELSARHRAALGRAREALSTARAELAAGTPLDLCAQSFRDATDALDGISGRTTPEDLLDRIFARFCLGK